MNSPVTSFVTHFLCSPESRAPPFSAPAWNLSASSFLSCTSYTVGAGDKLPQSASSSRGGRSSGAGASGLLIYLYVLSPVQDPAYYRANCILPVRALRINSHSAKCNQPWLCVCFSEAGLPCQMPLKEGSCSPVTFPEMKNIFIPSSAFQFDARVCSSVPCLLKSAPTTRFRGPGRH